MKQFTSNELRNGWLNFYKERGHVDVGAVSLVSDGSTGVMFNVAGMQPLMPYLLGKKHPLGTRLCNVQGCVRTNDIDSVGDTSHVTFFEMMGSWSLGDYFKEERTKWSFELLTQVYGFDRDHLAATVLQATKMHRVMKKVHSAESHPASKRKMYIICRQRITGGDWNTARAALTAKCFTSQMYRTAVRIAVPVVTAVSIQSLVMMFLCSMRSIKTVI